MTCDITKLKKRIAEAVPGIMELKFGCEVRDKTVFELGYGYYVCDESNGDIEVFWKDGEWCKRLYNKDVEILGRPIRIADVLLAIGRKNSGELVDITLFADGGKCNFNFPNIDIYTHWNLLEDDLDSQSEETKGALCRILCGDESDL